ncbi:MULTISPECIES: hypothetical protein [unclassified Cellulophaga]|uniref:hypothetical protein n=1 Tax=unclassified Cellulophaga TaxID=2634405 RepID=UPI0026E2A9BE|nr:MULTISPECIES: hypothetical protein [unclassified Cellulophaga]MDO6491221.1 hypothetical protein [Cellulophaga sp. 2_MG-2023]MDO6495246.1 hypothetical protein [Cellulophaga sp. 3_MG-2023]
MIDNLKEVKTEIINTIKLLIYKEDKSILDKINFNNDDIFIEPLLFSYFNLKTNKNVAILAEIIQGYHTKEEKYKLRHSYNRNEVAYIPKVGYFKYFKDTLYEPILKKGDFEIVKEIHLVQESYFVEFYKGSILNSTPIHNSVWKEHYKEVFYAIDIIRKYLPKYYKKLVFANKKIYLHDNPKILNFTSIETLGMLYFYVIGKNNIIYFIEELIHQGSHNYLYYVVHNRKDYFKIDVENILMSDYTKKEWDYRTIYGAFHGLFTVTERVECFDILLSRNIFSGKEKHELLGRLADQFLRFRTGLELLKLNEVFTEKGVNFYNSLDEKCAFILHKYSKLKSEFDLSNRDLDFRYDDFCILNPYKEFLKKDQNNYYQF